MSTPATDNIPNYASEVDLDDLLISLIALAGDSAEGYETAAKSVESGHYRDILAEYAEERKRFFVELTYLANQYNIVPDESQTALGMLHNIWIEVKNAFTQGDKAILDECVRGEEYAIERYHEALKHSLPEDVETLLQAELAQVKGAHERIVRLSQALDQIPD